jgi:hypothetical protein
MSLTQYASHIAYTLAVRGSSSSTTPDHGALLGAKAQLVKKRQSEMARVFTVTPVSVG